MFQVDNSGKSLDEYKQTGIYGGYNFSDKPISGVGTCILEVIAYSSTYCIQRLTTIDSDNTYCFIRRLNNGSWKEWVQITTTAV